MAWDDVFTQELAEDEGEGPGIAGIQVMSMFLF